MAAKQQHIAKSNSYRRIAEANLNVDPDAAGELLWGAALQAAQAAHHQATGETNHTQSKNGIIDAISRSKPSLQKREEMRQAATAALNLHVNFYHPENANPAIHHRAITATRNLIDYLINYATHGNP